MDDRARTYRLNTHRREARRALIPWVVSAGLQPHAHRFFHDDVDTTDLVPVVFRPRINVIPGREQGGLDGMLKGSIGATARLSAGGSRLRLAALGYGLRLSATARGLRLQLSAHGYGWWPLALGSRPADRGYGNRWRCWLLRVRYSVCNRMFDFVALGFADDCSRSFWRSLSFRRFYSGLHGAR